MRSRETIGLAAAIAGIVTFIGCGLGAADPNDVAESSDIEIDSTVVERGRYLVTIVGCADCHSPKVFTPQQGPYPDATRHLAGHVSAQPLPDVPEGFIGPEGWGAVVSNDFTAWVGPWGTSFAGNLTSDIATGFGSWTKDMFVRTIREGRHMGDGRPLLPPMPWRAYREMTDEDLGAIFAYLQSLPRVNNPVPEPVAPVGGQTQMPPPTPASGSTP